MMNNFVCPLKYAVARVTKYPVIDNDEIEIVASCDILDSNYCPFFCRNDSDEQCRLVAAVEKTVPELRDDEPLPDSYIW